MDYKRAQTYWKDKEPSSPRMDPDALRGRIEEYMQSHNTCALATGTDGFIRNTPIEYSYHDGYLWMFSEGGEKFIGLEHFLNSEFKAEGYDPRQQYLWQ